MKNWLVLSALLLASVVHAQENLGDADSLKAKLKSMPMDTNRVLALCDVAYTYRFVDVDSAFRYATQALTLSKQLHYKNGMAWSYLLIGVTHSIRNRVAQSISYYQKSIDLADSLHNYTIVCRALANIGWCMFDLEDYYRAIDYFKRSLTYQNILSGQDAYFITLQINIGQNCLANRQFLEAEKYFKMALAYGREKIPNYGYLLNLLSALRIEQHSYTTADSLLKTGWKLIDQLPDKVDKADNRYYFAKLKLAQGDIAKAYAYAEEAQYYLLPAGPKTEMERIYILLSAIESKQGNAQQALDYLLKSNALRDSVHSSQAKYSEFLFSKREQEREILLEQKDKELLKAEKQNQQILWISSLFIFAGAIVSLLFFVWQKQQANKKLTVLNDELVKKEAVVVNQNKLLHETNDSKDKLFSIIGHDLRSPLSSLQGIMDLLSSSHNGALSEEERKKYFHILNRQLKNLLNLTSNLLQWSFSQTNSITFAAEIFDIAKTIKENEVLLNDIALDKKITIINEVQTELYVWAHHQSINTVIRNLISNAIKFTHAGGKITICTEHVDEFIKVSVIDTGVGIAADVKDTLFKLSDKRSTLGTANEKGSGLGLPLCKEFVEKNGGTIGVETIVGKGSSFYFTVPVNTEEFFSS